ncbi:MAG: HAMP domain-containing sensor histidine kinase [Bdellovibrionota bacterium]
MKQKTCISLKVQVLGVIAVSFIIVLLCSVLFYRGYVNRQTVKRLESLGSKLQASSQLQVNQILPALIISEQKDALEVQLSRIRAQENLVEARFEETSDKAMMPKGSCTSAIGGLQICIDQENNAVTTSAPITFDGNTFGKLIKIRKLDEESEGMRPAEPLMAIIVALSLSFLILAIWIGYFLDRHIRKALLSLESKLEPILAGSGGEIRSDSRVKEINAIVEQVQRLVTKFQDRKAQAIVGIFATQVAHDIRSPLAALDTVMGQLDQLPEETRLIVRSAISRITDIANNLLIKNRQAIGIDGKLIQNDRPLEEPYSQELLPSLIDLLITEKRMQYRSRIGIEISAKLDQEAYGLFAKVQASEFKRLLSNLINNSVEAISEAGAVLIGLTSHGSEIILTITDNGKGIPPELLDKLGDRGRTYDKKGGSGLGLFHAKATLISWGGSLRISSIFGKGTIVHISLPKVAPPEWFVPHLLLSSKSIVVVLDDDASIHQIWQNRFDLINAQGHDVKLIHFSTSNEIIQWCKAKAVKDPNPVLYLVDYELLGQVNDGLEIIRTLEIQSRSVLVTSRYEEDAIRRECRRLGVGLVPKPLAGFIPISFGTVPATQEVNLV